MAKVEMKTYIPRRRTEYGIGKESVRKTHKRYRIRHKEGPYEVCNRKNVTFFESGIMLGMNERVLRGTGERTVKMSAAQLRYCHQSRKRVYLAVSLAPHFEAP
jgi:hypothetical protein